METAFECVAREVEVCLEPIEVYQDFICHVTRVFTEPCYEIGLLAPSHLRDCPVNEPPGVPESIVNLLLVRGPATLEIRPSRTEWDVPRDNATMREFDIGNTLNRGVRVLGGVVSIDVGKEVWLFDRVVSRPEPGEAI